MSSREVYLKQLTRIREEINRLFESALMGAGLDPGAGLPGVWLPAVDVLEEPGQFRCFFEVPSVDPGSLRCVVAEGLLEVSGRRSMPQTPGASFRRVESRYGPFRRTVELGARAQATGIETSLVQGVLEVRVQKQPVGGRKRGERERGE